jgi:nitrogen regulatory protein PII
MKEIKAYIKKHKVDEVIRALRKIKGLTGMSVIDSCGYGVGWGGAKGEEQIDCRPGVKVEIVCRDDLAEAVVAAIEKAAHTGLKGDGKIYVGNIEQAVRISTGERGEGAV